jgi:hypothetical protein
MTGYPEPEVIDLIMEALGNLSIPKAYAEISKLKNDKGLGMS